MTSCPEYISKNVPLSTITTIAAGGPADYLACPRNESEIKDTLELASSLNLPVYAIGGGSNILASDAGFRGMLVRPSCKEISIISRDSSTTVIKAEAGASWDDVAAFSVNANAAGIECLSGIPGNAGAAPVQNIGAYGQEIAGSLLAVNAIEIASGKSSRILGENCQFAYRQSLFKTEWKGRFIITSIELELKTNGQASIRYGDLTEQLKLSDGDPIPSLSAVRQAVLEVRKRKSMTNDPTDPNSRSAGSFFLNPIIPEKLAQELKAAYQEMPIYPAPLGFLKLSAAWLINHAGFEKGFTMGQAGLSEKHVLALINRGSAKAEEIIALSEAIQQGVFKKFGVTLEPEPNMLGF